MHSRWMRALLLPVWAMWFAFATTEPYTGSECPMQAHGGAGQFGVAAHAALAVMDHHRTHDSEQPKSTRCCTLGDCSLSPVATIPTPVIGAQLLASERTTWIAFHIVPSSVLLHPDLRLPFPNGPPHVAIA